MRFRALVSPRVFVIAVRRKFWRVRYVTSAAEMPFAKMRGGVTGGLQGAWQGWRICGEKVRLFTTAVSGTRLQKTRQPPASGVTASQKPAPRRRTNRRCGIILCEPRALTRESIQI